MILSLLLSMAHADDPSAYTARAGRPFLAYVGDTVVLSGSASEGPAGVELSYRWTQVEGPPVRLDDPGAVEPRFEIREPFPVVFELEVGDGETWSAPARSHVMVLDPDVDSRHGCASAPWGGPWLAAAGLLLLRRRRTP